MTTHFDDDGPFAGTDRSARELAVRVMQFVGHTLLEAKGTPGEWPRAAIMDLHAIITAYNVHLAKYAWDGTDEAREAWMEKTERLREALDEEAQQFEAKQFIDDPDYVAKRVQEILSEMMAEDPSHN